jgi:drug/metabolite transporter (DMT)-like permease
MRLPPAGLAALAMLGAVTIYGTNFAISRHGILNGLTPWDMLALRFATAGLVLLPVFWRAGPASCGGIGWPRGLLITVMSGFPMTFLMMYGLSLAPASHAASIAPGTVTTISAVGGALLFGAWFGWNVRIGVLIVLSGLACIGIAGSTEMTPGVMLGDLCFLGVGLLWGGYPLLQQLWKFDTLKATATMSVLSMAAVLPLYFLSGAASNLMNVPAGVVLFHAVNQGIMNMIVGLLLWGWAVKVIGAAGSGRFPPLIPIIGTLTAIPLLGEWPKPLQFAGIALIVIGILVTVSRWQVKTAAPPPREP